MPPRKKQNSPKVKKEDAEHRKRILQAQEKVLATKRLLLSIVETMIERNVSKKWFLDNCTKLCHADYDDVVQERSIERLCGYPLCSNIIKQTLKQKYQISLVTNKVYDLTERKCYCSNQCYKASNYFKAQLSPIPLYMRKEEKIEVNLLSECDNKGSVGEEIVFHETIPKEEIEKVYTVEQVSNNMYRMLNEEVKKCADSLGNLEIKENVFKEQFVFGKETPKKAEDTLCEEKSESDSAGDVDSDDNDDEKLFPSYDNVAVLSQKLMPVHKKIKKSVLIPPLKSDATPRSSIRLTQQFSVDFVYKVLKDWMTEDTMKYLFGEKYVYGLKADHLLERMVSKNPVSSEKLSSIKDEYIKLCLKIDSLPDDDEEEEEDLNDIVELGVTSEPKPIPTSKTLEENSTDKKVFKRRPKDKSKRKSKHVSFAMGDKPLIQEVTPENENEEVILGKDEEAAEESTDESPLPEPTFPLVDSVAQNSLRRQVLMNNLKSVYSDLLPVVGLHYTDVREAVRRFVETLSLTPTNISFVKRKEWELISLVLYRILTKTVVKNLLDELQFLRMCELILISIDVDKLEQIVSDLLSAKNIINIK